MSHHYRVRCLKYVVSHLGGFFYAFFLNCEKPAELMEHIIATSSRLGDVVADFFMGSGATIKAALTLGRKAIGVELEEETYMKVTEQLSI